MKREIRVKFVLIGVALAIPIRCVSERVKQLDARVSNYSQCASHNHIRLRFAFVLSAFLFLLGVRINSFCIFFTQQTE